MPRKGRDLSAAWTTYMLIFGKLRLLPLIAMLVLGQTWSEISLKLIISIMFLKNWRKNQRRKSAATYDLGSNPFRIIFGGVQTETCEGNKELLSQKGISIVHLTADIHSWNSADIHHECPHPPIPEDEARKDRWSRLGSAANDTLREVFFLLKNVLKDIQLSSLCCHTGNMAVYHSV